MTFLIYVNHTLRDIPQDSDFVFFFSCIKHVFYLRFSEHSSDGSHCNCNCGGAGCLASGPGCCVDAHTFNSAKPFFFLRISPSPICFYYYCQSQHKPGQASVAKLIIMACFSHVRLRESRCHQVSDDEECSFQCMRCILPLQIK